MPAPADAARLIDEYGQLDQQIQAYTPILDRHKALAATIRGWFADADPEASPSAQGSQYVVILTPASMQRQIADLWKVYKAFGSVRAFLAACTVTLKALEEHLGKERASALVAESRTGPRRMKVVPRLAAISSAERAA